MVNRILYVAGSCFHMLSLQPSAVVEIKTLHGCNVNEFIE